MSIEEIKTYRITCDTMRYTDHTHKLAELCDGHEIFSGEDRHEAVEKAKDAGWHNEEWSTWGREGWHLTCPFHQHQIDSTTEIWPPEGQRREQP